MSGSWWVGQDDLDEDQRSVITLPLESGKLIVGPPGSGKTNLLLLRANYMSMAGKKNISIVVFTRPLQKFISSGGSEYSFPTSKIQTCQRWQCDLLRQYGIDIDLPEGFDEQRRYLLFKVNELIANRKLTKVYDCIFLDEAQDYLPDEIKMFDKLSQQLFAVADERQKIYQGGNPLDTLYDVLGEPIRLRFHYRNGLKICQLADGIAKDTGEYEQLKCTSNYDEKENPSIVEHFRCVDIEDQANRIIKKISIQLKAYPNEMIGIICPKNEELMKIHSCISNTELASRIILQSGSDRETFNPDKNIIMCTFHGIKGLEVRSLHMAGCNLLKKFPFNRNMAYTAVTRAKTSLSLYYDDDIHSYLEAALESLNPSPDLPDLQDIFGGKK